MQKFSPVGMHLIDEAVNGIFPNLASRVMGLKIAEEILAGKNQAEDHPHHHNGSDPALFGHVALLQESCDALVVKERMNLILP